MSNDSRRRLLRQLIDFESPIHEIVRELSVFGWDCDEDLVVIGRSDVERAVSLYTAGQLSAADLESWADAIEGRDDIGFVEADERMLQRIIFEVANPFLEGPITPDSAALWMAQLSGQSA